MASSSCYTRSSSCESRAPSLFLVMKKFLQKTSHISPIVVSLENNFHSLNSLNHFPCFVELSLCANVGGIDRRNNKVCFTYYLLMFIIFCFRYPHKGSSTPASWCIQQRVYLCTQFHGGKRWKIV